MSDKPITGIFAGLFSAPDSAKAEEEYRRALENSAHEVATEASSKPASSQNEDKAKWIN